MAGKPEIYKSEPIRSGVLWIALVVQVICCAVALVVVFLAGSGKLLLPEPWHSGYQWVVRGLFVLPGASLVSVAFWIFRANKNARALSAQTLDNGPGWAVGWFFVPIASLWKPFEVMREIYKASHTPHDWRKAKGASIVGWWWAFQVFGNVLSTFIYVLRTSSDPLFNRRVALALYIIMIVHQTLLLIITTQIVKWQAKAHRVGGVENVF